MNLFHYLFFKEEQIFMGRFHFNYAYGWSMLVVLMGRYHHIIQIQPILQPTYIDIYHNQSTFHEYRNAKLRMISSQVKMIMKVQNSFPKWVYNPKCKY